MFFWCFRSLQLRKITKISQYSNLFMNFFDSPPINWINGTAYRRLSKKGIKKRDQKNCRKICGERNNAYLCSRKPPLIALWCNGSTSDSGSACEGSNPSKATLKISKWLIVNYLEILLFNFAPHLHHQLFWDAMSDCRRALLKHNQQTRHVCLPPRGFYRSSNQGQFWL